MVRDKAVVVQDTSFNKIPSAVYVINKRIKAAFLPLASYTDKGSVWVLTIWKDSGNSNISHMIRLGLKSFSTRALLGFCATLHTTRIV